MNSSPRPQPSPYPGITAIAVACFLSSAVVALLGTLARAGRVSLTSATFLLQGLELMGPVIFYLAAAVSFLAGVGLLRRWKMGRWLTLALIVGIGVGRIMPISSAVIDFRLLGIARDGAAIVACVVAARYLLQEEIRDQF